MCVIRNEGEKREERSQRKKGSDAGGRCWVEAERAEKGGIGCGAVGITWDGGLIRMRMRGGTDAYGREDALVLLTVDFNANSSRSDPKEAHYSLFAQLTYLPPGVLNDFVNMSYFLIGNASMSMCSVHQDDTGRGKEAGLLALNALFCSCFFMF